MTKDRTNHKRKDNHDYSSDNNDQSLHEIMARRIGLKKRKGSCLLYDLIVANNCSQIEIYSQIDIFPSDQERYHDLFHHGKQELKYVRSINLSRLSRLSINLYEDNLKNLQSPLG